VVRKCRYVWDITKVVSNELGSIGDRRIHLPNTRPNEGSEVEGTVKLEGAIAWLVADKVDHRRNPIGVECARVKRLGSSLLDGQRGIDIRSDDR
jgi:hypothetical protein